MPPLAPTVELANGVAMPALGLGTWPMNDHEAERTIVRAIEVGYRSIDTAEGYRNERGVGRAIRESGIDPAEVFVTTKFGRDSHSVEGARRSFEASAERLGRDPIDLHLIHWPNPDLDRYVDAWRGLVALYEEGRARAIGVSNFRPNHLERLRDEVGVIPHANQIQLSPYVPRLEERAYHEAHGIVTISYGPIDRGGTLLLEPPVMEAARSHGRTSAQVVLRWHVQHGLVPIPKTSLPERLEENGGVFDFELDAGEMAAIDGLDRGGRGAIDPETEGY